MEHLELILSLLFIVAISGILSKIVVIPLPLIQVFIGIVISQLPWFSSIQLEPGFFFLLFIPPLLFADGWLMPKREFFRYRWPILRLSIGLVFVTVISTGYFVHWLFPSIPLAAGFVLGAAISPTDAIATSAIIERCKIPSRIVNIIKGEALVNDASGLIAFKFAIAAVLTGTFSFYHATYNFFILLLGGIAIGFCIAWVSGKLRKIISHRKLSQPFIQVTLSVLTPFVAFIVADYFDVSGIIAVVTAGIYSGINDTRNMSRDTRMHAWEIWGLLLFLLNGMVFLLLGLELPAILAVIQPAHWGLFFGKALLVSLVVMIVRLLWVFPSAYIPFWFYKISKRKDIVDPGFKNVALAGWVGIRGAVTLAAALSIPLTLANHMLFPQRELLIFLASVVIITTLVLQTLSTPLLIKWLKLKSDGIIEKEEHFARIQVLSAAINALEERLKMKISSCQQEEIAKQIKEYDHRLLALSDNPNLVITSIERHKTEKKVHILGLKAERAELYRLHRANLINESVMRVIERELDYEELFVKTINT